MDCSCLALNITRCYAGNYSPYREIYREKYGEQLIVKETFILFTYSAFAELNEIHKKECIIHNYSRIGKKDFSFYYFPFSIIEREKNILKFLEKINQSKSDYSGALIDKIFVPPDEFDEIKERLEKDRIIFITGTAGYGKTYTAIKLLWDWYNKGYIPEWIEGKEPKNREVVREKLANIDAILKPHHIIYFEDPFGKTEYERRDDLKERINNIISSVKNKSDVYIIITSRTDIFNEFEKSSYSVEEVHEFEKELNILKPSYGYEKRKTILERWAEEKGCEWLRDERQKEIILDLLKSKEFLPTPLSIHDFVEATVKTKGEKDIRQKIEAYSNAVEKAFADEIKGLYYSGRADRVLFLSFIFVSEHLEIDFVKEEYEKLKMEAFEDFGKILKEEYRVKIGDSRHSRKKILEFSHPSYSKALSYILEHTGCKNMFCDVLRGFSQYSSTEIVGDVAGAIAYNFDKLPPDVQNLLFTISEEDKNAGAVANAISNNFDYLPGEVRNNLLIKLSKKERGAGPVARTVAYQFDKLPDNVRNLLLEISERWGAIVANPIAYNFERLPEDTSKLLFKLYEKDCDAGTVAGAIANNFDRVPWSVRNLLFKISETDREGWTVAWPIAKNFDRLPDDVRNLLFKISNKSKGAKVVAHALAEHFDKFPIDKRNELLIKLSEKSAAARSVTIIITKNFYKFPENLRDSLRNLLLEISERDGGAKIVAVAVAYNFERLPEDIRNLLFKISETDRGAKAVTKALEKNLDGLPEQIRKEILIKLSGNDRAASDVALIILKNFDRLPDDLRNSLLTKLSENYRATGHVSRTIAKNFNKLPNDIQNLLFKFSEKDWNARGIANNISENFDILPKDIRNELLIKLSEKDGEKRDVAKTIASNFNGIPENVQNLLDKLQEPLQQIIQELSTGNNKENKNEALHLISNTWPKMNSGFVSEVLNKLISDKDKTVREEAQGLLKTILSD